MALGERLRDRLRIVRVLAYAHMRLGRGAALFGWVPAGGDAPRLIRLRSGVSVLVRRRDAVPFYEQFGLGCYDVPLPGAVRSVLDLGANVGYAAVALSARHPGARFACVEPDRESFALLERNLALNHVDAVVVRGAVAGAPGRFSVASGDAPASNRAVADPGGDIEGVTVGEVLTRAGFESVDLIKVDVEGAEAEVFADVGSWEAQVRAIVAELHAPFGVADADALLAPHGYTRVSLPAGIRFRDVTAWVRPAR